MDAELLLYTMKAGVVSEYVPGGLDIFGLSEQFAQRHIKCGCDLS